MYVPTTPTARGQSFFQLDWSNGWKKKIKMATYTTAASDPVCQCIEQNKSF